MVNTRVKGQRTVRKGIQILTDSGYTCDTVEKYGKFVKDKDLFNLFDVVAFKNRKFLFIQFKTNKPGQKWKEPYIEFAQKHGSEHVSIQIWNWFDRKGFKIDIY